MTIVTDLREEHRNLSSVNGNKLNELNSLKEQALQGGGIKRIEAQHNKGKFTARERISILIDEGTFEEIGAFMTHSCPDFNLDNEKILGDSVITGFGLINNKPAYVYAQDFTVFGGTISEVASKKICRVMDMAAENGAPVIGLLDSGGARIQEGVDSLIGCGEIFTRNTRYSGVIPQISVIMGPCAGAAVYSPALTDFIFMVNNTSHMYITGPAVIQAVNNESINAEDAGDAGLHSTISGNCHFVSNSEEECLHMVRRILNFIPASIKDTSANITGNVNKYENLLNDEILNIVPEEPYKAYDMKNIIHIIIDDNDFLEVHERWGKSIICGFAKIGGTNVGIVAQQPLYCAGAINVDSSDKASRFIRFCDCFNIPIITLVDVPGYMPGIEQERLGIIRHGAKLLYAYAEATTAKISVIIRKAYGGAYIAMGSKGLQGDLNFAWPSAEIAVMGPEGAINILYRSNRYSEDNSIKQKLIEEYKEKFANPYEAASKGYIDDVIDPRETRYKIITSLKMLMNKRSTQPVKKHGNIPL